MELLAPAGNLESFHAALEAGADAVYLGLGALNARLRARNFTPKTLSYLLPYAHERNIRVYVTVNTLVKQHELEEASHLLYQLEQLGVDAAIVTDLGLIRMARRHFPKLELHGSTQMFLHNSAAVNSAERLGLKRVILPRELTIEEIATIKKRTNVELEVFVHGALCYSFSGACLASSFLGGASGNRGRCTQVCRRKFRAGRREGFYFSPDDLQALEFLSRFKEIGITSLKIEGRMRSAEYVHTVVSAYRRAIDDPAAAESLREELRYDLGREKTSLFLGGVKQKGIVHPYRLAGTGVFLGTVADMRSGRVVVDTTERVSAGDRLRVHPRDGSEGATGKVTKVESRGGRLFVALDGIERVRKGDGVYLTSSGAQRAATGKPDTSGVQPVKFHSRCPFAGKAVGKNRGRRGAATECRLLVKIDSADWLPLLRQERLDGIIAALEREELALLPGSANWPKSASRLWAALPPFIPEADMPKWRQTASELERNGVTRWVCGSVGQRELLDSREDVMADQPVWCINRQTQASLRELGFSRFAYSTEDDLLNIRAATNGRGVVYLFTHVPLFISRIQPGVHPGSDLTNAKGEEFFTARRYGLHYLVGRHPLCLFHRRAKLQEAGIGTFVLDLSFVEPTGENLELLLEAYRSGTRLEGGTQFNYKRGLK